MLMYVCMCLSPVVLRDTFVFPFVPATLKASNAD